MRSSVEHGVRTPHQDPGGKVRGQCWDLGCCIAEGGVRAWGPGDLGCNSAECRVSTLTHIQTQGVAVQA